jgi:hypothetical protein
MADSKVSNLTALASGAVDPISDLLYIVDNSVPEGKKITAASFLDTAVLQRAYTITINNSSTETDLVNYSIAANTLSTNRGIRVKMFGTLSINATTPTLRIRMYLGSTILYDKTSGAIPNSGNTSAWELEAHVYNNNASNAQISNLVFRTSDRAAATGTGTGELTASATPLFVVAGVGTTGAVDTTASQIFRITFTVSVASASNVITKQFSTVELV